MFSRTFKLFEAVQKTAAIKKIAIIALFAVIVFSLASCGDAGDSSGTVKNEEAVYTSVDSEGNVYVLTIIPKSNRATYEPQAGDSYTLVIYYVDSTTRTSIGTVTHKVKSGSTTTATLSVSETSFTVTLKTDSGGFTVMTEIKGEIPISGNDDDDTPPSIEIELTLNPKEDGGGNVDIPVTGVMLNKSSLYLKAGNKETLVAPILPFNATNKAVTWSSSNPVVATVSASGEVSAVAPGSATITVTAVDGGFTASCEVIVTGEGEYVPVAYVSLNKYELFLSAGESETLRATVSPPNASNKNVTWSSSNPSVATVSANGLVKGVANGEALISAITEDGLHPAYCPVTVGPRDAEVTGVTLNESNVITLAVGSTKTLTATVEPPNAKNKAVTWYSSDSAVASVSASGVVTAKAEGWSIISVTTVEGEKTAACWVEVVSSIGEGKITGVFLYKNVTSLLIGGAESLRWYYTSEGSNARYEVTWKSSNPEIVTVSQYGEIAGVSAGKATITITTVDGGFTDTCEVTVSDTVVPVTGISLDYTEFGIREGEYFSFKATVTPANATNQNVTWSSSDNSIAEISYPKEGQGLAKNPGIATITATTVDSGKTATCSLTVYPAFPKEITLDKSTINIFTYGTETLTYTLVPSDAWHSGVDFTSSNPSVATVEPGNGGYIVRGVSPGEAVITATTQNGKKATCKVTVNLVVISEGLASYLSTLPANTASDPYNIPMKVTNNSEFSIIKTALQGAANKFVILDISGSSTITTIPNFAFNFESSSNFSGCATLVGITIPGSVISIEHGAFWGCSNLASITIPNNVTSIGNLAFSDCASLASINIPNGVTSIGGGAFQGCTNLASINIPNGVTSIGGGTFQGCRSLTNITIPNSVTSIEQGVFENCTSLSSITIPDSVTFIGQGVFENCTSLSSITIPNSVTSIGSSTFRGCTSLASVTIPDSVTSMDWNTFFGCTSLTSVIIGSNVPSIPVQTFYGCISLASINIPNSVTSIGGGAFRDCTSLTNVTFAETSKVTSIGYMAFSDCASLASINIPNSVTSIGEPTASYMTRIEAMAFSNCTSLVAINVGSGNSAYSSEDGVLYNKNKTALFKYPEGKTETAYNIPNSVTSIGEGAFRFCASLTNVTFAETSKVTSIGYMAFSDCASLVSINIPNSVTSIGDYAFYNCTSLASISISASVTSIGESAFKKCTRLSSVTIPASVTSIGESAFYECTRLSSVTFLGMIPSSGFSTQNAFIGDLRDKYYAANGGQGTYTTTAPVYFVAVWTKQ